jgi:hypothetical protein
VESSSDSDESSAPDTEINEDEIIDQALGENEED